MCGGVSGQRIPVGSVSSFSPRVWRCFRKAAAQKRWSAVFSTCVEVFLEKLTFFVFLLCFLHVCGGVSAFRKNKMIFVSFSPRVWRCFLSKVF